MISFKTYDITQTGQQITTYIYYPMSQETKVGKQ